MERDATWTKMSDAAQQLSDRYCRDDTLNVVAQRRSTGLLTISEGLAVLDNWTDGFEAIRKRHLLSKRWSEVQSLEQATERIEAFLRERPDQAPSDHDS